MITTKFALFRLAFAMHPTNVLCLQQPVTRWIVLQKARRHPRRGSDSLYAHNFRFYFTPLSRVLLTFPSRYLFSIDRKIYLALGGGPSRFNQGFTCPDLLDKGKYPNLAVSVFSRAFALTNIRLAKLRIPGFHCLWRSFPTASTHFADL